MQTILFSILSILWTSFFLILPVILKVKGIDSFSLGVFSVLSIIFAFFPFINPRFWEDFFTVVLAWLFVLAFAFPVWLIIRKHYE